MPSIYMTNCPTCGCGGTGEYIVANVEWGICALPNDGMSFPARRLSDTADFKMADSGTMILNYDQNTGWFAENVSPIALQVSGGTVNQRIKLGAIPPAPSDQIPDSVKFIQNHQLPPDYCYDPNSVALQWECTSTWPTTALSAQYMYDDPASRCDAKTWHFDWNLNPQTLPHVHGASVNFCSILQSTGSAYVYGWLATTNAAYQARDYCNRAETPGPPLVGDPCDGMVWRGNGSWFSAYLSFYIKGTLTYYNFNV